MIDFDAAAKSENENEIITSVDKARFQLSQFKNKIDEIYKEAEAVEISSSETEARASEMTSQVKSLIKQIHAKQDEIIGPASRFVKTVQGFTLPYRKRLEAIEAVLKNKLSSYAYKKEMERRKAEAAAAKALAEAQRKIDREAKRSKIDPVQLPAQIINKDQTPIHTETGTTSFIPVFDFELEDISKVPPEFLALDEKKVRNAIRSGIREIAGLRIIEKMQVRTRTT